MSLLEPPRPGAVDLSTWGYYHSAAAIAVTIYLLMVRGLRYRRMSDIERPFTKGGRPLASMTVEEAHSIVNQLQLLEFPRAFAKARQIAQFKAGRSLLILM